MMKKISIIIITQINQTNQTNTVEKDPALRPDLTLVLVWFLVRI